MSIDTTGTPLGDLLLKVEDTAWPSDREYFKARPQRRLRIRPAWDVEIQSAQSMYAGKIVTPGKLPDEQCWWVLVWQMEPGWRMRFPFPCFHDMDPDPPEKVCKAIRHEIAKTFPEVRKLEKAFRKRARL